MQYFNPKDGTRFRTVSVNFPVGKELVFQGLETKVYQGNEYRAITFVGTDSHKNLKDVWDAKSFKTANNQTETHVLQGSLIEAIKWFFAHDTLDQTTDGIAYYELNIFSCLFGGSKITLEKAFDYFNDFGRPRTEVAFNFAKCEINGQLDLSVFNDDDGNPVISADNIEKQKKRYATLVKEAKKQTFAK